MRSIPILFQAQMVSNLARKVIRLVGTRQGIIALSRLFSPAIEVPQHRLNCSCAGPVLSNVEFGRRRWHRNAFEAKNKLL
jgi:hypothetical protein